jgi:hypothetical protein
MIKQIENNLKTFHCNIQIDSQAWLKLIHFKHIEIFNYGIDKYYNITSLMKLDTRYNRRVMNLKGKKGVGATTRHTRMDRKWNRARRNIGISILVFTFISDSLSRNNMDSIGP